MVGGTAVAPRAARSGRSLALAVAAALALASGCAGAALPADRSAANLYRDLQRLVTLAEAKGWQIDRHELDDLEPSALDSLCRTAPATRALLAVWLEQQIAAAGGPVAEAYQRTGSLDEIAELLELSRIRDLLRRAEAAAGDCPLWLEPERRFSGRQILDDRWLVSVSGGGKGTLVVRGGDADIRADGAGRLLLGRAVGPRWTGLVGLEVGAGASFPRNDEGERANLELGVDTVVPAVLRYRLVNAYFEAEVGYLAHLTENDQDPEHGIHLGASVGGSASRRRWIFPGAAFSVSYERTFAGDDAMHLLKIGVRAVIDLPF